MTTPYIVAGATVALAATATSSGDSITPAAANFGLDGANGPSYLKVTNTSATVPVFFKTGTSAPTATIPVAATSTGSNCIGPGQTELIKVNNAGQAPVEIFFAVIAASAVDVYVTPVTLAG